MSMGKWVILAGVCVGLPLIVGLACLPYLPDEVAVHWNWQNQPDGFAPKGLAIMILPLFLLLLLLIVGIYWSLGQAIDNPPHKRAMLRAVGGAGASAAILLAYAQGLILAWNLGVRFPFGWYLLPVLVLAVGATLWATAPFLKLEAFASREARKNLPPGIWFPAKRYGWGWGLPCAWQGWVAIGLWLGILVGGLAGILTMVPKTWVPGLCLAFAGIMIAAVFGLAFWRGEKPRWRWGDSDRS